jgi:hypothetical protein
MAVSNHLKASPHGASKRPTQLVIKHCERRSALELAGWSLYVWYFPAKPWRTDGARMRDLPSDRKDL